MEPPQRRRKPPPSQARLQGKRGGRGGSRGARQQRDEKKIVTAPVAPTPKPEEDKETLILQEKLENAVLEEDQGSDEEVEESSSEGTCC